MILKTSLGLFLSLIIFDRQLHGLAQQSTVPLPGNGESCNVVNLHCGVPVPSAEERRPHKRYTGSPGKVGPRGPEGLRGLKGEKGLKGSKGEEAIVNVTDIIYRVVEIFGASNCSDLRDKGMKKTGYYQTRPENSFHPVYVHCDFQVYEGAADCNDLRRTKEIRAGHYLVRSDAQSAIEEIICANNCSELRDQGIRKNGYYQIQSADNTQPLSVYCDFQMYEGVEDCGGLRRMKAIKAGRYLVRSDPQSSIEEIVCASTCQELFQSGIATSGTYTVGDGTGTFEVHCNFTDGRAVTEIWHDQMGEIQNPTDRRCSSKGCYSWTPNYQISRNHILSIIAKSSECRQFIRAKCVHTLLLGSDYAWWVSRDGEKMEYWGGSTSRRDGYCACGETGSCTTGASKCNCDSNNGNTGVDEGYLTDKTKLPVRELRFGDLNDNNEFVWHTLGKLECWGEA